MGPQGSDDGVRTDVVVASARVPGLLTASGWRALTGADVVVVRGAGGGWREELTAAVVPWREDDGRGPGAGEVRLDLSGGDLSGGDRSGGDLSGGDVSGGAAAVVVGAAEPAGAHLLDLVAVMDRLRSPGGCPWDAEQTHRSLAPHAIEEAYEVVDAVENGTSADVLEELGDLLFQVVFHARVAAETHPDAGGFTVDDVADGVVAKLVRRHPHVFAREAGSGDGAGRGGADAATAADVEAGWEALKKAEKGRASVLDGIPVALPALARAAKVLRRARRDGVLDGAGSSGVGGATRQVVEAGAGAQGEAGARLVALVAELTAAHPDLDVEGALRRAVHHLEVRVREAEAAGRRPS